MGKLVVDLRLKSESSLTSMHVADLRTIHDKLTQLVERAESILARSNEVFPSAKSSWLRKLKAGLGMLATKDGQTLEDTIRLCDRLVSKSSSAPRMLDVADVNRWGAENGYTFGFNNKEGTVLLNQCPNGTRFAYVHMPASPIGRIELTDNGFQFSPVEVSMSAEIYRGQTEPPAVVPPKPVPLSKIRMRQNWLESEVKRFKLRLKDYRSEPDTTRDIQDAIDKYEKQIDMLDAIRKVSQYVDYEAYLKFAAAD